MPIQEKIIVINKCYDDKVRVQKARSFDNQIRFYLNDDLYVAATEKQNGGKYKISFGDESIEKNDNGDNNDDKKRYKKLMLFQVLSSLFIFVVALTAIIIVKEWRFSLIIPCFTIILIGLINSAILNLGLTSKELRGKHSAEHMMIKFIEANNRMPMNLSEVRKFSRFDLRCGSRFIVAPKAEAFSISIISTILTIIFSIIMQWLFNSTGLVVVSSMIIYIILSFGMQSVFDRYKKFFTVIIRPIKNIIILINQLTLTSRKVKDNDLLLAYLSARMWMMIVYPEFYDRERDDTIWRENIVNIKIEEPDW